jgi:hypothetical protein
MWNRTLCRADWIAGWKCRPQFRIIYRVRKISCSVSVVEIRSRLTRRTAYLELYLREFRVERFELHHPFFAILAIAPFILASSTRSSRRPKPTSGPQDRATTLAATCSQPFTVICRVRD